mmetsp:Transcript_26548/g.61965  ORF Transcript_26548/g.61965 Transcript_26548/m.61965 type:complete len:258 (+) Transcript_26548:489-1262(+)
MQCRYGAGLRPASVRAWCKLQQAGASYSRLRAGARWPRARSLPHHTTLASPLHLPCISLASPSHLRGRTPSDVGGAFGRVFGRGQRPSATRHHLTRVRGGDRQRGPPPLPVSHASPIALALVAQRLALRRSQARVGVRLALGAHGTVLARALRARVRNARGRGRGARSARARGLGDAPAVLENWRRLWALALGLAHHHAHRARLLAGLRARRAALVPNSAALARGRGSGARSARARGLGDAPAVLRAPASPQCKCRL